jgi:hypothetical protein
MGYQVDYCAIISWNQPNSTIRMTWILEVSRLERADEEKTDSSASTIAVLCSREGVGRPNESRMSQTQVSLAGSFCSHGCVLSTRGARLLHYNLRLRVPRGQCWEFQSSPRN